MCLLSESVQKHLVLSFGSPLVTTAMVDNSPDSIGGEEHTVDSVEFITTPENAPCEGNGVLQMMTLFL